MLCMVRFGMDAVVLYANARQGVVMLGSVR